MTTISRLSHADLGAPRLAPGPPPVLHLDLPRLMNEHGEPMRLLASWLLDDHERANFYSGTGGEAVSFPIPTGARGYRLRRWPSEGLAPEYLDWWIESHQPSAVSGQPTASPHEEAIS